MMTSEYGSIFNVEYCASLLALKENELKESQEKTDSLHNLRRRYTLMSLAVGFFGISATGIVLYHLLAIGKMPVVLAILLTVVYAVSGLTLKNLLSKRSLHSHEYVYYKHKTDMLSSGVSFYSRMYNDSKRYAEWLDKQQSKLNKTTEA